MQLFGIRILGNLSTSTEYSRIIVADQDAIRMVNDGISHFRCDPEVQEQGLQAIGRMMHYHNKVPLRNFLTLTTQPNP